MIVDIVFYDLDSNNFYVYVMLMLKLIMVEGFGKKDRSWNEKKNVILWCEVWFILINGYFEIVGIEECIDYCFIDV